MKRPNILISAVAGDIGDSIVRAYTTINCSIFGCDMRGDVIHNELLTKFFKIPSTVDNPGNYLETIKQKIEEEKVDFFIPVSEPEIMLINDNRDIFLDKGVKLIINNSFIVDTFLDKYKTACYLDSLNIATPKTILLSDYSGDLGFPLIVKARSGWGSKSIWKVEDMSDLEYVKKKDKGQLIAQEYIGTSEEEYTTGLFSDGNLVSSISFKRVLGISGTSIEVEFVNEPFLNELSEKIANAVKLVGSINLQTRRLHDKFIPFEINPRFSSTLLFRKKFGFNDAIWWLNVLSAKGYHYERIYKKGRGKRYYVELFDNMEKAD